MNLVLLETAWGWRGISRLPEWFSINPLNHSGRRLHKIFGALPFLVGNSAPEIVSRAKEHGIPCTRHVRGLFLAAFEEHGAPEIVVIGGKIAEATFAAADVPLPDETRVAFMPHPAARFWSNALTTIAADGIQRGLWQRARLDSRAAQWIPAIPPSPLAKRS
jgi:hypothetical protein